MTDDSVYGPYGSGRGTLGKPKPGQQRPPVSYTHLTLPTNREV